ncbi:hypothetical protein THAOC_08041, partial [Thalassiosira oceanica]
AERAVDDALAGELSPGPTLDLSNPASAPGPGGPSWALAPTMSEAPKSASRSLPARLNDCCGRVEALGPPRLEQAADAAFEGAWKCLSVLVARPSVREVVNIVWATVVTFTALPPSWSHRAIAPRLTRCPPVESGTANIGVRRQCRQTLSMPRIPLALEVAAWFATMATGCVMAAAADVCANCGREGGEGVKLKNCTACLLVKYCGVDCQKAHRKIHKKACKERAAELKDERLYGQGHERPETEFCPICAQPVPIPTEEHSVVNSCCTKMVCDGCVLAGVKLGIMNACPFCRTPTHKDEAEALAMVQTRVKKKDPEAIRYLGYQYMEGYMEGGLGLEKDSTRAIELWTEAAELGSAGAYYSLGLAYLNGDGVEQDVARGVSFYEKAAMLGNSTARHNLGCYECERGRYDRGVRHLLISAKMGSEKSLANIKELFKGGDATKTQYAEALKGYQAAVEEMKSPDRKEAVSFRFG